VNKITGEGNNTQACCDRGTDEWREDMEVQRGHVTTQAGDGCSLDSGKSLTI
jgi:hypothetical protein